MQNEIRYCEACSKTDGKDKSTWHYKTASGNWLCEDSCFHVSYQQERNKTFARALNLIKDEMRRHIDG
jgi:hypothetical protein